MIPNIFDIFLMEKINSITKDTHHSCKGRLIHPIQVISSVIFVIYSV